MTPESIREMYAAVKADPDGNGEMELSATFWHTLHYSLLNRHSISFAYYNAINKESPKIRST